MQPQTETRKNKGLRGRGPLAAIDLRQTLAGLLPFIPSGQWPLPLTLPANGSASAEAFAGLPYQGQAGPQVELA